MSPCEDDSGAWVFYVLVLAMSGLGWLAILGTGYVLVRWVMP